MSHDSQNSSKRERDDEVDIDDVFDDLEELKELVDSDEERERVRETMDALRRTRRPPFQRLRDNFDSRDVGEALVGSFVFGMPMIVEDGTLDIGRYIARNPLYFLVTLFFGLTLVYGILHAVKFEKIEADLIYGIIPIRLISIPLIAGLMAFGLMTIWGRVEWATPWVALGQITVTAIAMAVGASLGDILPGT